MNIVSVLSEKLFYPDTQVCNSPSAVGWVWCAEDEGLGEDHHCQHSLRYGGGVSAHWAGAPQDVPEEGGGIHTAGLVAPTLGAEGEDEDEEVSAAPSAGQVTWAVGAQASRLLSWAWRATKRQHDI